LVLGEDELVLGEDELVLGEDGNHFEKDTNKKHEASIEYPTANTQSKTPK
jgi:hypothetical protein